jgi:hypothetical protein
MLEKETGRPRHHRLWVIHLIEANLNLLINILIARRFVWHGEKHAIFGEGQAGSRPGRAANDIVLSKELTYDMTTQTLHNLAMMENDTTACFDRMIPSMVMLALRVHGVPATITTLIGNTLANMRYHIKTKLGGSERYYQHTTTQPIYGTGQGSMGSPCFWLLLSTILFKIMQRIAHGLRFEDTHGHTTIQRSMEGFVDDANVAVTDFEEAYSSTQLIHTLQQDAQHWEKLLFVSGRKLELTKCFFYMLYWKFSNDGNPSLTPKADLPHRLMITQGNDTLPTEIEQKTAPKLIKS